LWVVGQNWVGPYPFVPKSRNPYTLIIFYYFLEKSNKIGKIANIAGNCLI
jgi:hypothetical protein